MFRSPRPNRSASELVAAITTSPAPCATCCRITCFRCCAWSRWNRRHSVNRETVRDEKLKVLQALKPLSADEIKRHTVTGQYGPGLVDGAVVGGYREDAENADSTTETFVAVKAEINNWRWAGVPFYLRTGQADVAAVLRDRGSVQTRSAGDVSR